jgi:hypothetical protein
MIDFLAEKRTMRKILSTVQLPNEVEVFPGIYERRYFLRGSLASIAAVVALRATRKSLLAQTPIKSTVAADGLAWDEFLKRSVPMAQQLIADPAFSIDEYLYRIGSLAIRLKEIPDTALGSYKTVEPRVWFGPSFKGSPFVIIQWRMEPGALLPAHNHPNASVCTLGFAGEVRLRNFEIIGEAPDYASKKAFRVRETRNEMMCHGKISTLSPLRDNIHCFQVGSEGARGIDINTLHGTTNNFSFLNISKTPADSERRIFEATWSDLGRGPAPAKKS